MSENNKGFNKSKEDTYITAGDEWWNRFTRLAIKLYPRGPEEMQVWRRAGGDLSFLELNAPGRASWFAALLKLRQGGGGELISVSRLIEIMDEDHPNNRDLFNLKESSEVSGHAVAPEPLVSAINELDYSIEDQPWYVPDFPETIAIHESEIGTLAREIDIVIITATNVELKSVLHLLRPYPARGGILLVYAGPETYYIGEFGNFKAVVTKCRMGSISEGSVILATEQCQRLWKPRAAIMVGIAFGKDPTSQGVADVLVASQVISYESQRIGEEIVFRGPIPPSNGTLLNRFENVQNWRFLRPDGTPCALHIGPILSGEKLIDDPHFKAALFKQFPQAIGGEMEGAGLCAASGRVGTPWILVKAICDWADGKKHKKYQPLAAAAAASLVHHVLSQKHVLDSLPSNPK